MATYDETTYAEDPDMEIQPFSDTIGARATTNPNGSTQTTNSSTTENKWEFD